MTIITLTLTTLIAIFALLAAVGAHGKANDLVAMIERHILTTTETAGEVAELRGKHRNLEGDHAAIWEDLNNLRSQVLP